MSVVERSFERSVGHISIMTELGRFDLAWIFSDQFFASQLTKIRIGSSNIVDI